MAGKCSVKKLVFYVRCWIWRISDNRQLGSSQLCSITNNRTEKTGWYRKELRRFGSSLHHVYAGRRWWWWPQHYKAKTQSSEREIDLRTHDSQLKLSHDPLWIQTPIHLLASMTQGLLFNSCSLTLTSHNPQLSVNSNRVSQWEWLECPSPAFHANAPLGHKFRVFTLSKWVF
jgi:hypothetical protein